MLQVTSVFSATIPEAIEKLSDTFMEDPVRVTIGQRNATACNIQQQLQFVGSEEGKILMLQQLLEDGLKAPALIFVASKEKAMLLEKWAFPSNPITSSKRYLHLITPDLVRHLFVMAEKCLVIYWPPY